VPGGENTTATSYFNLISNTPLVLRNTKLTVRGRGSVSVAKEKASRACGNDFHNHLYGCKSGVLSFCIGCDLGDLHDILVWSPSF
jgi:hypothetical protein